MTTRITRSPRIAAAMLRSGGVVAFPTETVYGLGADAFDPKAVRRIFRAKGRPADNPLIVHIADLAQLERVAARITPSAQRAIEHFFPGPLTVIVPRHPSLPPAVTAGLDSVGVRFPGHPVAQAFLKACGVPVAAPSANRSGRPSPTTWRAVAAELDGRVDGILQGGSSPIGLESTVMDCTRSRPRILRAGAVTLEQLRAVLPDIQDSRARRADRVPARSPGMKYRHYAPRAQVSVIAAARDLPPQHAPLAGYIGLSIQGFAATPKRVCRCGDVAEYARRLFHFFRACEQSGITHIYCERVAETGFGVALMDRIHRAEAG